MPDDLKQVGDLDIEQDLHTQHRVWIVQRVGWGIMVLIVLLAMLGLLGGSGPMNQAVTGTPDEFIRVDYPRFGRLDAPMTIDVTVRPKAGDQTVELLVSRATIEALNIEKISPEPSTQQTRADGVVFVFDWPGATLPTTITFHMQPVRWGKVTGRIGFPDEPALILQQFIYP